MTNTVGFRMLIVILGLAGLALVVQRPGSPVLAAPAAPIVTGRVTDHHGQPINGAQVTIDSGDKASPLSQAFTQPDGRYALSIAPLASGSLTLHIVRAHFQMTSLALSAADTQSLRSGETITLPDIILARRINLAFWIATLIFILMLALIATGRLHNTLSALVGVTLLFAISYLGRPFSEDLFIFDFHDAISYVDWNVVFLMMGMMIVIAIVEKTGVFRWLAFAAYRLSGGRNWLLVIILMFVAGIASALLDNVTTMLLMSPITIQIALAAGMSPLTLLVPAVLASNVAGVSTLIGTPTNILIGSYGHITFSGFLTNLTPGVLLALVGLSIYCEWAYRRELNARGVGQAADQLLEDLAQRARITQPGALKKAGVVGAGMLILFVFGEYVHLQPSVTALMGATALLVWIKPDMEEMIKAVDWTTLVFFMALFIVVGAIQEVGLISAIADGLGQLIGSNLLVAMLAVTWISALLSTVIANIPFTAAMLPVIGYLTASVPGAQTSVLFYCLSVGSAMGGNGSLIGAAANMVTAGISEQAGHPITYAYFFKKGFPAMLLSVGLAMLWLLLRFLVLGGANR